MLTDEQEALFQQERKDAPEAKLMEDDDFDAVNGMDINAFMMLPEEDRKSFHSTAKYHFGQRMAMHDLTGITIGGKSIDEVAAG